MIYEEMNNANKEEEEKAKVEEKIEKKPEYIALRSCLVRLSEGRTLRLVKGKAVEGLTDKDARRLKKYNFVR